MDDDRQRHRGRIAQALPDRQWLDRLTILDDGPTVQIVDSYEEHAGEFGRLLAIVSHDESEDHDEIVLGLPHSGEIALYRDQISSILLNTGVAAK